jgi:hypothetical protein
MSETETITVNGREYSVEISHDTYAGNPFQEFDMATSLVLNGGRDYIDAEYGDLSVVTLAAIKEGYSNAAIARWLRLKGATGIHLVYRGGNDEIVSQPVEGQTLETERYAQGMWVRPGAIYRTEGFAFLAPGKAAAEFTDLGYPDKSADLVAGETKQYAAWAAGEVFGYSITDENGEEVESCSGYYGWDHDESGLMEQAKDAIEGHESALFGQANRVGAGFVGVI